MSRAKLPFSKCWLFVSIATVDEQGNRLHYKYVKKKTKSQAKKINWKVFTIFSKANFQLELDYCAHNK